MRAAGMSGATGDGASEERKRLLAGVGVHSGSVSATRVELNHDTTTINEEHGVTESVQAEPGALFPEWKPGDWTARQRTTALSALMLLGGACSLIAWAFAQWGTGPNAMSTVIPIGMSVYCLGTIRLADVFWYANRHAHNSGDAAARNARGASGILYLEMWIVLFTLALQVIGSILVATGNWDGWRIYSPDSFILPMAICGLLDVGLSLGASKSPWHPTRDSAAPVYALVAPATGARLIVRGLIMLLASANWLLIAGPFVIIISLWGSLNIEDQSGTALAAQPGPLFAIAAAVFFAAAVVECLTLWKPRQTPA